MPFALNGNTTPTVGVVDEVRMLMRLLARSNVTSAMPMKPSPIIQGASTSSMCPYFFASLSIVDNPAFVRYRAA